MIQALMLMRGWQKMRPDNCSVQDQSDINKKISHLKALVENRLLGLIDHSNFAIPVICEAMEYSLQAGGKRLRPILCLTVAGMFGRKPEEMLDVACALELIHTYSLVHDDLPAMDDDDFRRNKPSCHRVYGEAMAILVGDALLTLAFELLARYGLESCDSGQALHMINELAQASGYMGMLGGQVLDLAAEGKEVDVNKMELISTYKTGALLQASVKMGAIAGGAETAQADALNRFAGSIGLAFQIADDLLNHCGDSRQMGKNTGTDRDRNKATYPLRLGEDAARNRMDELYRTAINELEQFGESANTLRHLTRNLIYREK